RQQAHAPSIPRQIPLKLEELQRLGKQQLKLIGKIRPGITEIDSNPRARSAVMRVAEKLV
ncbi:MAG TPA: 16S rRNA (cytosine(1402)-N(4))-methyltransferase, partial [Nitrosomonas sp.]|nr:16S rRNA (cytosine(1402)-N(4))-methyltransferase [Nitrosomonas sp.]